jgi:hypothetical protein
LEAPQLPALLDTMGVTVCGHERAQNATAWPSAGLLPWLALQRGLEKTYDVPVNIDSGAIQPHSPDRGARIRAFTKTQPNQGGLSDSRAKPKKCPNIQTLGLEERVLRKSLTILVITLLQIPLQPRQRHWRSTIPARRLQTFPTASS